MKKVFKSFSFILHGKPLESLLVFTQSRVTRQLLTCHRLNYVEAYHNNAVQEDKVQLSASNFYEYVSILSQCSFDRGEKAISREKLLNRK